MKCKLIKKNIGSLLIFLVPLFIVLSMVMINTFAKYYASWQLDEEKTVTSQVCNFVGDEFGNRSISSAEPMILFGMRNYDSNGVYTLSNITYSINIKDSNSEDVSGLTIQPTFTDGVRTISGGSANEDIIKITGFPDGITNKQYKITVSMSMPYEKTLDEVTYTITHLPDIASDSLEYEIDPAYVIRKIQTNDFAGTKSYTLNWDTSKEYPDPTDSYVGNLTGSSGAIELLPNSTYSLRFVSLRKIVTTPEGFYNIRNDLSGDYMLGADIDLSGYENWEPIGDYYNRFTGTLDGNGYTISNVSATFSGGCIGVFGSTSGATIQDLKVKNASIYGTTSLGVLIGLAQDTMVHRCYISGVVQGSRDIGGIIGRADYSTVSECASNANISGDAYVGGLLGLVDYASLENKYTEVIDCYSKGNNNGGTLIGGCIGWMRLSGSLEKSYSIGTVAGSGGVGGIIGDVGSGTTKNSYYNSTTSGQSDTGKGTPLNSSQVTVASNFTGFDFDNIWTMTSNGPVLKYFEDELT